MEKTKLINNPIMKKIKAEIVADSINPQGDRITTYLLTFPRFILAELNTHRVFSKNSASSRAIPFEKMVKMVEEDPFVPIAWQKDHKGMQGTEYMIGEDADQSKILWDVSKNEAINAAIDLHNHGTTKQLCNRLLEPFMWHTVLLTGTEFENFFELRCPKYHTPVSGDGFYFRSKKDCIANHSNPTNLKKLEDMSNIEWLQINSSQAEIHIQALAEAMWDAMNESTPKELKSGEWHIPFGDKMSDGELRDYFYNVENNPDPSFTAYQETKLKVSTARCARLSYMTFDGKVDYGKDIKLHDILLESHHMSPFEHCARAMSNEEYNSFIKGGINTVLNNGRLEYEVEDFQKGWCNNFKGFIQYRYLIEGSN
jgi:thymidylate synthase ThyX